MGAVSVPPRSRVVTPPSPWRQYARLYRRSWRRLALATVAAMAQAVALIPVPLLFMRAFDQMQAGGGRRSLVATGLAILVLQLVSAALASISRHQSLHVSKHAVMRLRQSLLEKLYLRPRADFTADGHGPLHALLVYDTERIDAASNAFVGTALPAACLGLGVSGVLWALNWTLFLVMVAVFPVMVAVNALLRGGLRRRTSAFHEAFERFSRGMWFVLEAMDLTRLQAAEPAERDRQHAAMDRVRRAGQAVAVMNTAYWNLQWSLVGIGSILVLVVGGLAVAEGRMTLGELVSFYAGLAILRTPLGAGLQSLPQLFEGSQALQRVMTFLGTPDPAAADASGRIAFRGHVQLDGVTFAYDGQPVLDGASLELRPGSAVGLVGASGAGKSTLVMLVLGFYRPQSGRICMDGVPLEHVDLAALRRQVGVLPQDPLVFPGTIWQNVTYGAEEVDRSEVLAAVRAAGLDEFVGRCPAGFDTVVGERGMLLSGGQRQRIALARALVRRPSLVMLDEPTNHLDAVTAAGMVDAIRVHCPLAAVLVISHDVRVIGRLDAVYTLADGVVTRAVGGPMHAASV